MFIDTHSHIYAEEFDNDREEVIQRALAANVRQIVLPDIDNTTRQAMLSLAQAHPDMMYPTLGVHPTSVNESYKTEMQLFEKLLGQETIHAIGECGIDLYWDKTWLKEQLIAFEKQVQWALHYQLPIVIHCREAFDYIYKVLQPYKNSGLTGIFHSFTGTPGEAARMMEFPGFKIGINGVVTFKKSTLPETLKSVPLERIVLETDSPYLTPVPNRGKRNESANVKDTLIKVAEIYNEDPEKVAELTAVSALKVFGMLK